MSKEKQEEFLTAAFRRALRLSDAEEDALWGRFAVRRSEDAGAWAAFRAVMGRFNESLRAAMKYSSEQSLWRALGTDFGPCGDRVTLFGVIHIGT